MEYALLFRNDANTDQEFETARWVMGGNVFQLRSSIPDNSIVIGRYSVLPFYKELEEDLLTKGSRLINTHAQHKYIADMEYYQDVKDFTFKTWFDTHEMMSDPYNGPVVVKGKINSRKHEWDEKMFAEDKIKACVLGSALHCDDLLAPQGIIYRQYVPLETFEIGIHGLRFTNEWRFFFLGNTCVGSGYYWSNASNESLEKAMSFRMDKAWEKFEEFTQGIADIVSKKANFFVLDIAMTESGEPILVEINDGQMSGLSMVHAKRLYSEIKWHLPQLRLQ